MASTLRFVDSIATSPSTRLDLNDKTTWRLHLEGTSFPPPPLDRIVVSTLMVDGAAIPASAYGLRTLTLTLSVNAATADATATAVQALFRELNRPRNILRWHQETTEPVFFRTYRTSADQVEDLGMIDGKRKLITVNILADPFALGVLETPISAATLNTDPATNSYIDATGIKGDVDTPMYIKWPATAIAASRETLFAVRRHGTPSAAPFLFQAESQTNGTDTSDQANGSFSGAGGGTRTTFATTTMVTRSTISDLGTASVDLRGTYRVYARYAKTVSGDTIACQIVWGTSGGTTTTNDAVTLPSGTGIYMMDLGLIQVPRGQDPVVGFDGAEVAASDTYHLAFQASRSGSGNLDLDYFILVPADEGLSILKWVEAGPSYWWLDGDNHARTHARNASDQVATAMTPGATAPVPSLAPNQTNRIYMVYEVGSGLATTLTTITVTVSYHPRYVHVRPAAT